MATYYFSPSGSDAADGLSELNPWTPKRLTTFRPAPGDVLRFVGNAIHPVGIHWAWLPEGPVGDPDNPILLDNYGSGVAEIVAPDDQPAFTYTGPGGITLGKLQLCPGWLTRGDVIGAALSPQEGECRNVRVLGTEFTGWPTALRIEAVQNVLVQDARFHHNGLPTYLYGLQNLAVDDCKSWQNDWLFPFPSLGGNNGMGLVVYASKGFSVSGCEVWENGLRTTLGCGPAGFYFDHCDGGLIEDCVAWNNGDAAESPDGQGMIAYCSANLAFRRCTSVGNLTGFSLFHDAAGTRGVTGCQIEDGFAANNATDLHIAGSVWDCAVTGSKFLGGPNTYKNFDVTEHQPGDTRRVRVYGNEFRALGREMHVEAVPGLAGVELLEANAWVSYTPVYRVLGRDYDKLGDALRAQPLGPSALRAAPRRRVGCHRPEPLAALLRRWRT